MPVTSAPYHRTGAMARGADLFVVCKNCGSEVSPYVTECPYCGQRVRKRAPKIDRDAGTPREPRRRPRGRRARPATARGPRLGRLRPGEIPGLRADGVTRPWATMLLVAAMFGIYLLETAGAFNGLDLIVIGPLDGEWWRAFTAPLIHVSGGTGIFAGGAYPLAAAPAVGGYGWVLERPPGARGGLVVFRVRGAGRRW